MRKIISTLLGTLVLAVLVTSCKKNDGVFDDIDSKKQISFMKESKVGVYEGYEKLYTFDLQTAQVTFTDDFKLYLMTSADQSAFVKIELSDTPTPDALISAEVTVVGEEIACPSGTYNVRVVKSIGETRWLWDEEKLVGFLLKY